VTVTGEEVTEASAGPPIDAPVLVRKPKRRKRLVPHLLLIPALVAVLLVMIAPMLIGVLMSFLKLTQFTIGDWTAAPWAGLINYRISLNFSEPIAKGLATSFEVTALYTIVCVGVSWVLGMAGAVFLSDSFKGRAWLRSLFLLPYAIPVYVGVIVWTLMFQQNGAVNTLLGRDLHIVGAQTFWLASTRAFWSMAITTVWRTWPFAFLMLLAGLQSIPNEQYEAARVDGASRWQEFRRVTLPSVHDVSLLLILITGFWTFNDFTTPFIMFSTAPPSSAQLISLQIYIDSIVDLNFGLGAAMAVIMIILLIIASFVYMRLLHMKIGEYPNA
jgi:multiple sugar transport system permease protein